MFCSFEPTIIHQSTSISEPTLRAVGHSDAKMLCDYFVRNREFFKPWDPVRDEHFHTVSGWKHKITLLKELEENQQGLFVLILDPLESKVLGVVIFSQIIGYPYHSCHLGYSLDEQAQGKGLMNYSLKMACDYVFRSFNVHRIQASYLSQNQRSANVLKRVGFEEEGVARQYLLIDGHWQDHVQSSLINQHWEEACKD
ncbi:ribosomal protein S5-alanine N-acetyltransferase [Vibrio rarus]|uniref:ribosomal protein S5-alanine N-acetyltransferase n=1 Tax=Vibrio rarus TaxID=413403 RepID=UPI0021C2D102|nr:ribosomal protein S5-alanine N-acetyltransferase [Vibrio rarus]